MAGFTAVEIINRSPEEVFQFMTDLYQQSRWISGMVSVDPITRGPMRAGSKWCEIRRLGDREASTVIEVEEHRKPDDGKSPPYTHAIRSVHMGIQRTYHYRIDSEGEEKTRAELTAIVKGLGLISNLFVPFVAPAMKRRDGAQLRSLKQAIEALPIQKMVIDSLKEDPSVEED